MRSLLMGGQACVLYGGAELSRDTDNMVVADAANLARLQAAIEELRAEVIAALRAEEDAEREADRHYWAPLKRELEQLRHAR